MVQKERLIYGEKAGQFGNLDANMIFLRSTRALENPGKVLEIGSGYGNMLNFLINTSGIDAVGTEIDRERLKKSRDMFGPLPIHEVDSAVLPFADQAFDLVLSFDVFEHIPNTDEHMREVHRVLRPGGRYLFQTPNKYTNSVFETIRFRSLTAWKAHHCSLHSYREVHKRLAKHGFECQFHDVPIVNDYFVNKVRHYFGSIAVGLLKVANPDKLPYFLRTNFYVESIKKAPIGDTPAL